MKVSKAKAQDSKRERINRPYPPMPLKDAIRVGKAISDNNAGKPFNRILLAEAMEYSASTSRFRDLITSSGKFGLTKGSYASDIIELTPLGIRVVRPTSDAERLDAVREAMRQIPLFAQLIEHFKNNKLPTITFFKNLLEREPFTVPPAWATEAASVFIETGRYVGIVRETKGGLYILPDSGVNPSESEQQDELGASRSNGASISTAEAQPNDAQEALSAIEHEGADQPSVIERTPPTQFFVAHGRDHDSLAQLKDMLTKLTIPFVVAQDEAHAGRPISQKVADLMRACSGGIFVFTGDEKLQDMKGEAVLRPRLNVVFELGAASLLYGQKIVIFKEKNVEFPTDFRDIGYIEFERGQLAAKSMELMMELIKLKALKLVPAAN